MKLFSIFFSFVCLFVCLEQAPLIAEQSYILHRSINGRLGDQLTHYIRCKWVSYKTKLPLLLTPFEGAERVPFFYLEEKAPIKISPNLKKKIQYVRSLDQIFESNRGVYYHVLYTSEFDYEGGFKGVQINWKDRKFLAVIKEALGCLEEKKKYEDSVALHLRLGSGGDGAKEYARFHLKFMPFSFYLEALVYLSNHLQKPLSCCIYTDRKDLEEIEKWFLNYPFPYPISFSFSMAEDPFVDFFEIMRHDYLIRSASYFSLIASYLGDFHLVIAPQESSRFIYEYKDGFRIYGKDAPYIGVKNASDTVPRETTKEEKKYSSF